MSVRTGEAVAEHTHDGAVLGGQDHGVFLAVALRGGLLQRANHLEGFPDLLEIPVVADELLKPVVLGGRLQVQGLEHVRAEARLLQCLAHPPGMRLEQSLRPYLLGDLEHPGPRRFLEVLLYVVEVFLGPFEHRDLHRLGLARHRVEGQNREGDRGKQHRPRKDGDEAGLRVRGFRDETSRICHAFQLFTTSSVRKLSRSGKQQLKGSS